MTTKDNTMTTKHIQRGDASLLWDGGQLEARHGSFVRTWKQTDQGLATCFLADGDHLWHPRRDAEPGACDWGFPRLIPEGSGATLSEVSLEEIGATLRARLSFNYKGFPLRVRFEVSLYPDAPGLRTRLALRAARELDEQECPSCLPGAFSEAIPLDVAACRRRAAGYYNNPQHRNHDWTPILRTDERSGPLAGGALEIHDWANLLTLDRNGRALTLVKESHKCVNQAGIDTGAFLLRAEGAYVTGLGLKSIDFGQDHRMFVHDQWRESWATWCVPSTADEAGRQLALKRFDRARFERGLRKKLQSRANTWGTRFPGDEARSAACETVGLREIESCTAIALAGMPLFFMETSTFSGAARDEVRTLLQIWRAQREALTRCYRFPIGAEPSAEPPGPVFSFTTRKPVRASFSPSASASAPTRRRNSGSISSTKPQLSGTIS